jgi:Reverse transcriptase (RNA-dependent DNA polymerase)
MAKPRKTHALRNSPFFRLRSPHKLAELLRISHDELRRLAASSDALYREFDEEKPSGGKRHIESPHRDLKMVQARAARLLGRITPADYLYCPVKRRCYVSNAAQHRGHRVVRCLDIRKYFPSTPAWRVHRFFHTVMECESDVAGLLTRIATYQGHLPTGSPVSPIMAYFAYYDVWESVAAIARQHGYTLTVYVDDVTLSGQSVRTEVLWQIKRAIHRSGLRYHKEKTFIDRPAEITGVIVDGDRLVAPRRQFLKLHEVKFELLQPINRTSRILHGKLEGLRGQMAQIGQYDRNDGVNLN